MCDVNIHKGVCAKVVRSGGRTMSKDSVSTGGVSILGHHSAEYMACLDWEVLPETRSLCRRGLCRRGSAATLLLTVVSCRE